MMFICVLLTISATIFLFFSIYRYDKNINEDILEILEKTRTPGWVKRRRKRRE